jgi:hypothetical protein
MSTSALPPGEPYRDALEKVALVLTIILITLQIELAWINLLQQLHLLVP